MSDNRGPVQHQLASATTLVLARVATRSTIRLPDNTLTSEAGCLLKSIRDWVKTAFVSTDGSFLRYQSIMRCLEVGIIESIALPNLANRSKLAKSPFPSKPSYSCYFVCILPTISEDASWGSMHPLFGDLLSATTTCRFTFGGYSRCLDSRSATA